ncbi:MAG: type I-E CRISPR-associated protein Cas5/CasD [Candidatus Limousia pullorum]|nr:type I-E CRISPR-associated protein Cas5/CasD [Candidatus Limousia pullorum]
MSTLLLRMSAPLQAWGYESKFETRRTSREPTKSGVIGLLASALGRSRDESVQDLNELSFGVRVDHEGELLHDYHTVKLNESKTYVTHRYYLSDAVFLVGLESDNEELLQKLNNAVLSPAFPLFLGRRSCPPTLPLSLGIRECSLLEALQSEPWLISQYMQKKLKNRSEFKLRIITDSDPKDSRAVRQKDVAVSFDPRKRQYGYRPIVEHTPITMVNKNYEFPEYNTEHDVMAELTGGD